MDENDIIQAGIFSEAEDWNSFVELSDKRWQIQNSWIEKGRKKLMSQLMSSPYGGWGVSLHQYAKGYVDGIKLYLAEYGDNSIMLIFGWDYEFHLYVQNSDAYDLNKVNSLLKLEEFAVILSAFERIDRQFEWAHKAMHYRNFHFGSPNDGELSRGELAWFAGNKTEDFVKQCVAMIEKFTCDPAVTSALRELHGRTLIAPKETE